VLEDCVAEVHLHRLKVLKKLLELSVGHILKNPDFSQKLNFLLNVFSDYLFDTATILLSPNAQQLSAVLDANRSLTSHLLCPN